jgi:glycosyltransferase domain-containing protein
MNSLCILIPSHERHSYLRRCISYYSDFPCRIFICDSSEIGYQGKLAENISYIHLSGMKFSEKVVFALNQISEDLVAMVPDDDFLLVDTLERIVHEMQKRPLIRACVGDVLSYPDKPPFRVIGHCSGKSASAVSTSAEENIVTYLGHYHQILWSVFRRDTLLLCFQLIKQAQFSNDNFFELSIATLCAGKGGISYLDDYWILREVTEGDHWGSRHVSISKESVDTMDEDVCKFRQVIDRVLFTGAADLALSSYLAREIGIDEKSFWLSFKKNCWVRAIDFAKRKISAQPTWEIDPRFRPIRKAIGY